MPEASPRPRALVVDQDPDVRILLLTALARAGFACEPASDGIEGLGWAAAATFELVVAEADMPRLDGVAMVARARARSLLDGAAVILLAASDAQETNARNMSPDLVLRQPLDLARLIVEARRLAELARERRGARAQSAGVVSPAAIDHVFDFVRSPDVRALARDALRTGRIELRPTGSPRRGVLTMSGGEVIAADILEGDRVVAAVTRVAPDAQGAETGAMRMEDMDLIAPEPSSGRIRSPGPTARPPAPPGADDRLGPYVVLDKTSFGTQTMVYRARRVEGIPERGAQPTRLVVQSRRPCAPEVYEAVSRLSIEGSARLLRFGALPDGRSFHETEQPVGSTLDSLVSGNGRLSVELALGIIDGILAVLARAHARGVPHGGLDARKVVLQAGGAVVLLDLGLSPRGVPDSASAARAAAPEVWRGGPPTASADLYACGVLLFLSLTGRYPFESPNPLEVCREVLEQRAPTLAEAGMGGPSPSGATAAAPTRRLEEVVARLLAKDPEARYASAEEARAALASCLAIEARADVAEAIAGVTAPSGYRLLRRIGAGAHASVYQAFHETLGRVVAIKMIRDDRTTSPVARARFLREARLAASLVHPCVVQVIDAREEAGRIFLVMELVDGESARARLLRDGAFPEAEALHIARDVLDALAAAHARGIVHRDVKPDNILLVRGGRAKVADFGLARSLGGPGEITREGEILGTPLYMPPETARGEPHDERSDLYSLGATLYHLVAGRPPFAAGPPMEVIDRHLFEAPPALASVVPGVSPALAALVGRLLTKDPAGRPQDAGEARGMLG